MRIRKILVVDDEMYVTQLVAFHFRRAGDCVYTADEGAQGLDAAITHGPDLIIADYQMPVLDGMQMCAQLLRDSRTSNIPVVMLTGRGHRLPPDMIEGTNIRVVMAKPFSSRELMARVEELIGPARCDGQDAHLGDELAVAV